MNDRRRTPVAFGNSMREGEFAVLFVGVPVTGAIPRIADPDELQRMIDGIARAALLSAD
ncbi:MAG: hypothetical protein Q8M02_11820 [Candidatus Didemnitutus sp.]|nr:hypothetical protein [Candidatus Didemnitutus sp.]